MLPQRLRVHMRQEQAVMPSWVEAKHSNAGNGGVCLKTFNPALAARHLTDSDIVIRQTAKNTKHNNSNERHNQ